MTKVNGRDIAIGWFCLDSGMRRDKRGTEKRKGEKLNFI